MTTTWVRQVRGEVELSGERERHLARLAREGDREARAELIRSGLPYVAQRARLLGFRGDAFDDAVQQGCLGLIEAVDRFDPDRGARLKTFAWWRIGAAMRAAVPVVADELPGDLADVAAAESDAGGVAELVEEVPEVLRRRYRIGEEDGLPRSREEVGRLMNLSPSQVRRLEDQALRELRNRLATVTHRASETKPIPHSSIGRAFDC
ncbi:sigma factor [Aeromicrobium sp.]|uniref:sigma factor n=1 Tax=Aeromicrobium sp. TaxID=1871063 RepID=UPI0039E22AF9